MTVRIFTRNVYGNPTVYPADDYARIFTRLTGRKTFRPDDIIALRDLGFAIEVVADPAQKNFGVGP